MSKKIDSREVDMKESEKTFTVAQVIAAGAPPSVDVISEPVTNDVLALEKFMAEEVTIEVHAAATPNDPQMAFAGVNGKQYWIPRGRQITLSRAHVAVLATARTGTVEQRSFKDHDGADQYEERSVLRITYPFSVISDPNPAGYAWLKKLLSSPE